MVYWLVVGGGLDQTAIEAAVKAKFSWISFLHCVAHIGRLVMNDIGKVPLVTTLVEQVIDIQTWSNVNGEVSALLVRCCRKTYRQMQKFLLVPDTCFVQILLLWKCFKCMGGRMRVTNLHDIYNNSDCSETGVIDARAVCDTLWTQVDKVWLCVPLLMLVRLGDAPSAALSKLRKTACCRATDNSSWLMR